MSKNLDEIIAEMDRDRENFREENIKNGLAVTAIRILDTAEKDAIEEGNLSKVVELRNKKLDVLRLVVETGLAARRQ